jgi:hypothetical protein
MANAKNEVNFYALMKNLREQKPYMVNKMVNLTSRFRESLHQNKILGTLLTDTLDHFGMFHGIRNSIQKISFRKF